MNTSAPIHQEAELWAASAATGGLTETELKAWNDHIAACPACKQLNEEESAMARLIKRTLDADSPDPSFEQRMLLKLNKAGLGNRTPWYEYLLFHPGLAVAATCCVLVVVGGIGFLVRNGKQPTIASTTPGALDGLPPAVRSAIQTQSAGKTVINVERDDAGGETLYNVATKTQDGSESDFTVAGDGTLLDVETAFDELPAPLQAAIKAQVGQGGLKGIDKTSDDGETNYVATITQDGRERDFTFGEDGTLLSVEADLAELPVPLHDAIKTQVGQGRLEGINKTFDDGETNYVATITLQNGRERDFTFNADGSLASVEVSQDELPAPVQAAIQAQVGKGKLDGIDKTFDDGETSYDASMTSPDGRRRDFSISEQGKLLSREVALNEAPASVQQTILQTLGKGQVVEIDQSFDEPNNIVPYEIEGRKDGKSLHFMVSPTGDLLGMED